MAKVTLTEDTFILGSLHPAGTVVDINLADYGLKSVNDTFTPKKDEPAEPVELAPNIEKPAKGAEPVPVEIAAVAPAGPNPTKPQAVPPDATQTGETYVDSAGSAITPETTDTKAKGK